MGDTGDDYRALNAHNKKKKANNLEKSTKILVDNNIDFESKNNGIHLIIIDFNGDLIDFYPSTGKWITRKGKSSRGIKNLLRHINDTKSNTDNNS